MIHQRYRQTDRQTTCDRKTALCTIMHHAVKMNETPADEAVRGDKMRVTRSWTLALSPFMFLPASLTIKRKRLILLTCRLAHLSVCLSGTVATRLNGSGCRLGR